MNDLATPGQLLDPSRLVDVPRLVTAYFTGRPDPAVPAQRVAFGTSGHRGSSFAETFNEAHILAITQAVCRYRRQAGHRRAAVPRHRHPRPVRARPGPPRIEVLAANGVEVVHRPTTTATRPTPVISHAILAYNRGRTAGLADGIVITPSHNPPEDGGFKYNPPHGGPAGTDVTALDRADRQRAPGRLARGRRAASRSSARCGRPTCHRHDFIGPYVDDLAKVVDMDADPRRRACSIGIDPLGGASVGATGRR